MISLHFPWSNKVKVVTGFLWFILTSQYLFESLENFVKKHFWKTNHRKTENEEEKEGRFLHLKAYLARTVFPTLHFVNSSYYCMLVCAVPQCQWSSKYLKHRESLLFFVLFFYYYYFYWGHCNLLTLSITRRAVIYVFLVATCCLHFSLPMTISHLGKTSEVLQVYLH